MDGKIFLRRCWRGCCLELGFPWVWEQVKNFVEGTEDGLFSQENKWVRRGVLSLLLILGWEASLYIDKTYGFGNLQLVLFPYLLGVVLGLFYYAVTFERENDLGASYSLGLIQYILLGGVAYGLFKAIL